MQARRLRSTSATTTRCVGTPWREGWFLAVMTGVHQITLPRNPKVCDCPRRSANAKLRATRLCSSVRKNEVRAGRGSRSRGFRQKNLAREPRLYEPRAPFCHRPRAQSSGKPCRIRTGQDPSQGCLPKKTPCKAHVREERAPRRGPRCFPSWVVLPACDDHSPHRANRSLPLPLLGTRAFCEVTSAENQRLLHPPSEPNEFG